MRRPRHVPRSVFLLPLVVCLLTPSFASAQTLFGPKQYTLTSSTPQTTTSLISTTSGPAYLHLTNGAPDGTARLTSASITLNGLEIISPQDLGPDVAIVDKPITLLSTNALIVTLTGPVSGTLSLTLERRSASLTSVTPASGRQGETLTVSIVGSNTHFVQGTTQLFAGPGISVGGAPSGTFGPVTVQDLTHFTATLTIQPTTILGPRTLLAKTNGEKAALFTGFTVLAGTPAISGTTVSTLAGTGTPGSTDGPGSSAQFRLPFDVAPRADGSSVVADTGNSTLRQITSGGAVSTVSLPVTLLLPAGVTMDASGRTVIVDTGKCVIRILNADGTVTTIGSGTCGFADSSASTARFKFPRDVVSDNAGNLYVADTGNFRVRKIDPQGNVTTLAGTGAFGSTDGPAATATFGLLAGIAIASDGTVFISDAVFHKIRQIAPDGTVSTLAGTGVAGFADGPATSAQVAFPTSLTRDDTGNLYITDTLNNLIRRLTPAGVVETIAGTGARGSQDGAGSQATFTLPLGLGLATAAPSRVFVADTFNHKIRVIQVVPPPTITALAPTSAVQGDTFTLTVTGTNLTGATAVSFLLNGTPDSAITVTNISVNADGTQLTATVNISVTAALGTKVVTVTTAGGTSSSTASSANTFIVLGRLSLIPTFQTLTQGGSGGLTVEITTPAPAGGLAITLTSTNTAVATLPPSVLIPQGSTSVLTTVSAVGEGSSTLSASATGYTTATAAVTVVLPPPTITSFSPSSGVVGTSVTITGGPFSTVNPGSNTVSFTGSNNTRIPAPVTTLNQTQLQTTAPQSAVTGPLQVTTPYGSALSTGHFIVLPSPDFSLTAVPSAATTLQGGQARYTLSVTGTEGFSGLISLSTSGLPSGVTATFAPPSLTSGQSGTLTLQVGSSTATGVVSLTLTGTAMINSTPRTRTTTLTLDVQAGGRTALLGQFLLNDGSPLPGVRVTLGTVQGTTDAAGAFLLLDVPSGTQMLGIDANVARPGFPIYGVDLTLVAGQTTVLPPFRITPPPPSERFTPINNATADQVITDPRFPGASITLPAGVTITGWDGTPKTKIAIERLTPDRLPMPPPSFPTNSLYQFHFGTPMGGLPSAPLPVTLPNDSGLEPGEKTEIWYYDAAPFPGVPAGWRLAGSATVSEDGTQIVSDPGVGIARFCGVCGAACFPAKGQPNGGGPTAGEPVDLALGQMVVAKTDLILSGRLPLVVHRSYNPFDPFGRVAGFELGFGPGWALSVDVALLDPSASNIFAPPGPLLRLILPGNIRYDFVRQPDGRFLNTTHPRFAGAVLTATQITTLVSEHRLRLRDGTVWRFVSGWRPRGPGGVILGLSLLVEQADRNGNRLTITRDSFGGIQTITAPDGRQLRFTNLGRITAITDPLGRTVRYTYGPFGFLETVTDPDGGVTRYTYDASGRILTITDPRGITYLTNEYDTNSGQVIRQTQADGGQWTFRYVGAPGAMTSATVIDPRGSATTYRMTSERLVIETVDALGQPTRMERDARGQVTASADALGRVTRFTYDANGNLTSITDPAGNVRTFTYEPTFNKVTSVTDPLGNVTTFEYDTQGNLVAITDPEQNKRPEAERLKTRLTYNAFGQPTSMTDPLGNVTMFEYDTVGNLIRITDPLGNVTTRTYDAVSRLITQTDPRGFPTQFAYDPLNRLSRITDPLGGTTAFTYDLNGNLLTVTDARGSVTTHTYDAMDRLLSRTDPLGRGESYQYDPMGNLTQFTDRKNQVSTFTYDALNRRTRATFGDGAFTEFVYDAIGRLTSATDSLTGTITEEYDALNRLLRETTLQGSIQCAYDAVGRRTQMTVNGQAPVSYTYDANSRLRTITQAPLAPVDIQYDATGRRTLLRLPNGVTTAYDYDLASRLTRLTYTSPSALLGDLTYQYDAAGNRTAVGGSFARTLLPDPVASATYDAANQQLAFGNKTMTYDNNGNLATLTETAATTTFTWDARNRLVALSGPGLTANFQYDALGRRVQKVVNGPTTQYHYDGFDIIRETVNGAEASYLRTMNVDETLAHTNGPIVFTYLADALRNTVALTDPAGALAITYTYDPFGRALASGLASFNPFQFTGRENDGVGLYYYRARYYSPVTYRNISEDSFGFPLAQVLRQSSTEKLLGQFSYEILLKQPAWLNLYVYVQNNPLRFRDPFGLVTLVGGGGFSGVAGRGVEGSVGGYYNTATGEAGGFVAGGVGVGLNASVDAFGGVISGELQGITANSNFVLGPVSLTLMFDPFTGEFVGFTLGLGPLIPGIPPFGFSETISATGTICFRNCPRK